MPGMIFFLISKKAIELKNSRVGPEGTEKTKKDNPGTRETNIAIIRVGSNSCSNIISVVIV